MKAFDGFKSEASNKFGPLPAGPYVAKILNTKIDGDEPDQYLVLRLDISEGPRAGYFTERYNRETEKAAGKYVPKFKGDYRIRIPNDENRKAQYPDSDKRRFNDAIYRIEQSNDGYHWDWDERGLIGLTVGINMQDDEFNGQPFTRIGRLEIAEDIRKGLVKPMQPRNRSGQTDKQTGFAQVEDTQLPWF